MSRIKQIEAKLKIGQFYEPMEYFVSLSVYKDRTFEESMLPPGGYGNAWCNDKFGVMRGKQYLGQCTYQEKPHVAAKLKEIYQEAQNRLLTETTSGMSLIWCFIFENEKQELTVKFE